MIDRGAKCPIKTKTVKLKFSVKIHKKDIRRISQIHKIQKARFVPPYCALFRRREKLVSRGILIISSSKEENFLLSHFLAESPWGKVWKKLALTFS